MVKTVRVTQDNQSPDNLSHKLDRRVTILTNPQVLENPNRPPIRHFHNPIRNRQFLAMVPKHILLLLFLHIMQNQLRGRYITFPSHPQIHLLQKRIYSLTLYPGTLLTPLSLIFNLNLLASDHLPDDAYKFERSTYIPEFHGSNAKIISAAFSPKAVFPWILLAPRRAPHVAASGSKGIFVIRVCASFRRPALPRRSIMHV
ncbi:hypothetical protein MIMGU_mgv1a014120mg [Erythranthe guttata]|uniref:Uncharacterized protein n=1 Tax=Erythranthe guttata TaxID=4155 RepID=A0A022Q624_ERYGU|nr:hypothetical protein MIMGU_mgv1a014120mg [Erythranthe guttata]